MSVEGGGKIAFRRRRTLLLLTPALCMVLVGLMTLLTPTRARSAAQFNPPQGPPITTAQSYRDFQLAGGAKGTRVTVTTPASGVAILSVNDYFLASSFAQSALNHGDLIQTGVTYEWKAPEGYSCDKGDPSAKLYFFTETALDFNYVCFYLADANWSSNHLMQESYSGGSWYSYMDGVLTGSVNTWSTCGGLACLVSAFGEEAARPAEKTGFWRSIFGFSQSGDQPFQYSPNGSTWTTVTSSSPTCPGVSGCVPNWSFTGSFPTGRWSETYCLNVTCIMAPARRLSSQGAAISAEPTSRKGGRIVSATDRDIAMTPGMAFRSATPDSVATTLESELPLVKSADVVSSDVPGATGLKATLTLSVPGIVGDELPESAFAEATWEGELFGGVLADTYLEAGWGKIQTIQPSVVLPNGSIQQTEGGIGAIVPGESFKALPADAEKAIVQRGAELGLKSVTASRLPLLGGVLVVRAMTDSPAAALDAFAFSSDGVKSLIGESPWDYEGLFLEIDDSTGAPVFIDGIASRASAHLTWVRPDLRSSSGMASGH